MQNRWFHKPRLHSAAHGETRRVGWLELFYDLVYVAAIIQLGNALSHHVSWWGFIAFAGVFTPMWLAWTEFTFYNNRYIVDDFLHRALVFGQMFGIGGMAVSMSAVLDGEIQPFLYAFAAVRVLTALMTTRTWYQLDEVRLLGTPMLVGHWVGAVLWLGAASIAAPWNGLIAVVAVVVDVAVKVAPGRLNELAAKHPPDVLHMSERYGLLTLIVLGESFVKVLGAVADHGPSAAIAGMTALSLAITFSLWWIYFDDVAGSRIRRTRLSGHVWVWSHLPLTLAITAVGVAIKKAVFFDPSAAAPEAYRTLLAAALALTFLSVAMIDTVTERRQSDLGDRARVVLRLGSAALIGLAALTGGSMTALVFIALLSGVCVLQVFADLSMAPFADPEEAHHEDHLLWDAVADEVAAAEPARSRRLDRVRTAVRKGVPNEFRRDLYYHFMSGSWTRMFVTVAAVWVLSNVFFGALYLLEPGSVSNVHNDHFLEAFSFSVQTMSSVGYGVMAPQTDYAHALVAVEALVGLVGIAIVTGLVFAKASRPTMSVMFSRNAVIHLRDGLPTFEFRVGNARGTEVVEASIHVVALIREVSAEGHSMSRLHDMQLHRSMTPMFAITWSVMHTVDEASPIQGVTPDNLEGRIEAIICTLTGHDATYGQTAHARHIYDPEDILFGHGFVDMIGRTEDSRLLVDFGLFHETKPSG